jgi:hypothetical protein
MKIKRTLVVLGMVGGLTLGTAAPALSWGNDNGKCNAGRGNGSETTPANDCDPGNSGAVNNGGD